MKKLPKILNIRKIIQTKLFRIEEVDLKFSNNEERVYERINGFESNVVLVMPIINDEILLIREYAVGTETYELGFVKGAVDHGEEILMAANRELKEEIGYGARELIPLRAIYASPNTNNTLFHIFIAKDLYPEKLAGDEPEPLEIIAYKISGIDQLLISKDFRESRNIAALYMLRDYLQHNQG